MVGLHVTGTVREVALTLPGVGAMQYARDLDASTGIWEVIGSGGRRPFSVIICDTAGTGEWRLIRESCSSKILSTLRISVS